MQQKREMMKRRDYGSQKQTSPYQEEDWDRDCAGSQPSQIYQEADAQHFSSNDAWEPSLSQFADADAPFETMTFTRNREVKVGQRSEGRGRNHFKRREDSSDAENWRGPANHRAPMQQRNEEQNEFQQRQNTWSDSNSGVNDDHEKRQRDFGNKFENDIEYRVPLRFVGLIIGRGAANIRDLQEKSNTKLFVEKNRSDDNGMVPVRISGNSQAQEMAMRLIDELISSDNRDHSAFGHRESQSSQPARNIEVPSQHVGKIIGRGGSMISDLQVASGAKIKVNRNNSGPTTSIAITGTNSEIENCEQMINDLVFDTGNNQGNNRSRPTDTEAAVYPDANLKSNTFETFPADSWENNDSGSFAKINLNRSSGRFENKNYNHYDRSGDREEEEEKDSKKFAFIDWDKIKEGHEMYQQVKWKDYPPVKKDFYIENREVAGLSQHEVEQFRKENNKIMVQYLKPEQNVGRHIPNPVRTFEEAFGHNPEIMHELKRAGFTKPSPIQMQAWPVILQGHDLIGIAQTGTGKTLAFLLPAFIHIEGQPAARDRRGGANVLVLTPTRELALQIEEEVKKYKYKDIKCVCVYGGGNRREQINVVNSGVEIIIATPGRLIDLINNNIVDVKSITYLILDEADRMLDLGFQPDIRKILLDIRPERQTIMTSATWPEGVRYMATNYMNNPVQVFVGSMDLTACHLVTQKVLMVDENDKFETLIDLLASEVGDHGKAIVFMGRKATVDYVSTQFIMREIACQSIHGNREQCDREQALDDLKSGAVNVLLATDVASRGIDIKDVTHVINYDFPHNIEEYVHRVGRTGRAGQRGQSITFMARNDWKYAKDLITIMEEANQEVPQAVYDMATRFSACQERRRQEGGGGGGRSFKRGDSDFNGFGSGGGGRSRQRGKDTFGFSVGYM